MVFIHQNKGREHTRTMNTEAVDYSNYYKRVWHVGDGLLERQILAAEFYIQRCYQDNPIPYSISDVQLNGLEIKTNQYKFEIGHPLDFNVNDTRYDDGQLFTLYQDVVLSIDGSNTAKMHNIFGPALLTMSRMDMTNQSESVFPYRFEAIEHYLFGEKTNAAVLQGYVSIAQKHDLSPNMLAYIEHLHPMVDADLSFELAASLQKLFDQTNWKTSREAVTLISDWCEAFHCSFSDVKQQSLMLDDCLMLAKRDTQTDWALY